jgi:hypothetical protein
MRRGVARRITRPLSRPRGVAAERVFHRSDDAPEAATVGDDPELRHDGGDAVTATTLRRPDLGGARGLGRAVAQGRRRYG